MSCFSIEFYFQKSSQRKVKQASQVQQNKSPRGREKNKIKIKIKADKDRRPDDTVYTTADIFFGVAVPVDHSTNSWYSSHQIKTNSKIRFFF